jgi:hypothetical protein
MILQKIRTVARFVRDATFAPALHARIELIFGRSQRPLSKFYTDGPQII